MCSWCSQIFLLANFHSAHAKKWPETTKSCSLDPPTAVNGVKEFRCPRGSRVLQPRELAQNCPAPSLRAAWAFHCYVDKYVLPFLFLLNCLANNVLSSTLSPMEHIRIRSVRSFCSLFIHSSSSHFCCRRRRRRFFGHIN